MTNFITPQLPKEAIWTIRQWNNKGKPAFQKVVETPKHLWDACPNCVGIGVVYISLCEPRPTKTPRSVKQPSMWYDGDGVNPKGWYLVAETNGFPCPVCQKRDEKEFVEYRTEVPF